MICVLEYVPSPDRLQRIVHETELAQIATDEFRSDVMMGLGGGGAHGGGTGEEEPLGDEALARGYSGGEAATNTRRLGRQEG